MRGRAVAGASVEVKDVSMDLHEAIEERPWLAQYRDLPHSMRGLQPTSPLAAFRNSCDKAPDALAIQYFDAQLTYADLDRMSDAFANWLAHEGIGDGGRVMITLNNTPHSVIALVGTWKRGAVPVPCNPMYRARELGTLIADCNPAAIICESSLHDRVLDGRKQAHGTATILTVNPYDFQNEDDARVLPERSGTEPAVGDFLQIIREFDRGGSTPGEDPDPEALALILYTSGTTGAPKGAMLSHRALAHCANAGRIWTALDRHCRHLVVAPTFHITGIVCCCCTAFIGADCLIMTYRFHPAQALETIVRYRPNFVVAAATDGYRVDFSWSEIYNSPVGDSMLIYYEKDGNALGDEEGRIAMVSGKDVKTGPRHVKWLQSLDVRLIAD